MRKDDIIVESCVTGKPGTSLKDIYRHYSSFKINILKRIKYIQNKGTVPNGFEFFLGNMLENIGKQLTYCYEVDMNFDKICIVKSYLKLVKLVGNYGNEHGKIDWTEFGKNHDGIYFMQVSNIKQRIADNKDIMNYKWFLDIFRDNDIPKGYIINTNAIISLIECCS